MKTWIQIRKFFTPWIRIRKGKFFKPWIRIRIKWMRIRNPVPLEYNTKISHLDVLHEENKADLAHVELHVHVGDTAIAFPLADNFVENYDHIEYLKINVKIW